MTKTIDDIWQKLQTDPACVGLITKSGCIENHGRSRRSRPHPHAWTPERLTLQAFLKTPEYRQLTRLLDLKRGEVGKLKSALILYFQEVLRDART